MIKFVRGWRRKIGVVTLAMACVFVGGWMRSLTLSEGIGFYRGMHPVDGYAPNTNYFWTEYSIYSEAGCIYCRQLHQDERETTIPGFKSNSTTPFWLWSQPATETLNPFDDEIGLQWRWRSRFPGISAGEAGEDYELIHSANVVNHDGEIEHYIVRCRFLTVQYWSIVLPLTATSAYLLLTKSNKSTQKKISEPIANEGFES